MGRRRVSKERDDGGHLLDVGRVVDGRGARGEVEEGLDDAYHVLGAPQGPDVERLEDDDDVAEAGEGEVGEVGEEVGHAVWREVALDEALAVAQVHPQAQAPRLPVLDDHPHRVVHLQQLRPRSGGPARGGPGVAGLCCGVTGL